LIFKTSIFIPFVAFYSVFQVISTSSEFPPVSKFYYYFRSQNPTPIILQGLVIWAFSRHLCGYFHAISRIPSPKLLLRPHVRSHFWLYFSLLAPYFLPVSPLVAVLEIWHVGGRLAVKSIECDETLLATLMRTEGRQQRRRFSDRARRGVANVHMSCAALTTFAPSIISYWSTRVNSGIIASSATRWRGISGTYSLAYASICNNPGFIFATSLMTIK